jgi:hypothetical protein
MKNQRKFYLMQYVETSLADINVKEERVGGERDEN